MSLVNRMDAASRWTPRQRRAITLLAQRGAEAPAERIAAEVGVGPRRLARWRRDPAFQQAVCDSARDELRACLPAAKNVVIKKALEEGDKECLKLILRIAGVLGDEDAAAGAPPANGLAQLSDAELVARAKELSEMLNDER